MLSLDYPVHTDDFIAARRAMVDNQIATSSVTDPRLLSVLRRVPREIFVPEDRRALAYSDSHHPLGQGRFLPAPAVFARLVQLAEIIESDRVLDYAPATGYSAAVLAGLASAVVALEPDPAMAARARSNLATLGIGNVTAIEGDLSTPLDELFDVILVEGAVAQVPDALVERLAPSGRLVCLVRQGPVGIASTIINAEQGIVRRIEFNATLPSIDLGPAPEAFVF